MTSENPYKLSLGLYPKQALAYSIPAQEVFYGGSTRGGKSHMVRVALISWCTAIPGLQCLILREHYSEVLENHMQGKNNFHDMLRPLIERKLVKITENSVVFANGSRIVLSHCGDERAARKIQGIGKDVCVFEECCNIREKYIRWIRGWCTVTEETKQKIPEEVREHFPKILYTGNPIGVSQGYFRRAFVKAAPKGTVFTAPEHDGGFKRVYIEALVEDNPSEDPEATRRRIKGLGDEATADALLNANWDAPVGNFYKEYDDDLHTCPDFIPPKAWQKGSFITFDWGSSEPFYVGWWCVSDGREFQHGLQTLWFPRGALIQYREWNGCDELMPSKGLGMPNYQIAQGIISRTHENTSGLVLTDSLPFQARGSYKNGREYTIADEFADEGVPLVRANTQRVYGWKQVRDRMIGKKLSDEKTLPMIYFCQSCKYIREYLPMLSYHPTKPEDAEEDGEATHSCDTVRYAACTKPIVYDEITTTTEAKKRDTMTVDKLVDRIIKKNKRERR